MCTMQRGEQHDARGRLLCQAHGAQSELGLAGVFPVVISRAFALALTIYTVATQLLLYYVRSPK